MRRFCFGLRVREPFPDVKAISPPGFTHWPVQIRLVLPPPFLCGADLLVAADCTPVAYPRFHDDLLRGKTVLRGCPKFDDTETYVSKFAAIFETTAIKSVTVVVMEVPCCQGLPVIVRKGMALAGKKIPLDVVVISARGEKKGGTAPDFPTGVITRLGAQQPYRYERTRLRKSLRRLSTSRSQPP